MSEPLIVEVWGEPAGVVLQEGKVFRFHATADPFFEPDGTPFNTPGHARLAAARLKRADERVVPDTLRRHRDGRLS